MRHKDTQRKRRSPATVGALFVLLPLLSSCAVVGRRCENVEVMRRSAPDQAYDAVLYSRTCDEEATSSNISLVSGGARVSEDIGNVFQAAGAPDTSAIRLLWEAPRRLVVQHPEGLAVLKREPALRAVAVRYETAPDP
jgi:hypothetical protein